MFDKLFNVDFRRLALWLLPDFMRKPRLLAFLYAAFQPLATILYDLNAYRKDINYKLTHTGQVCYLRAVLNDAFDNDNRRIRIEDVEAVPALMVYDRAADRPIMAYNRTADRAVMLPDRGSVGGVNFAVIVPASMQFDRPKMEQLLNYYKLAGMTYIIKIDNNL